MDDGAATGRKSWLTDAAPGRLRLAVAESSATTRRPPRARAPALFLSFLPWPLHRHVDRSFTQAVHEMSSESGRGGHSGEESRTREKGSQRNGEAKSKVRGREGKERPKQEASASLGRDQLTVVDRDRLSRVARLVDADEPVRELKHVGPERDDDELGRLCPLADVVGDDADVAEVERGVDLVHKVERRRLSRRRQRSQPLRRKTATKAVGGGRTL